MTMKKQYIQQLFYFSWAVLLAAFAACSDDNDMADGELPDDNNGKVKNYRYDEDSNTYEVYTKEGLLTWAKAFEIDKKANCILKNDINMGGGAGINWPVKLEGECKFEGNKKTIRGLVMENGFFDRLWGGSIRNLTLEGISKTCGFVCNGTGLTLQNCTNLVRVEEVSISGAENGGIAGRISHSLVHRCKNKATIGFKTSGGGSRGGIAGDADHCTFTECTNEGDIIGDVYIGGIVGFMSRSTILSCVNTGKITGSSYVGGITGDFADFHPNPVYNTFCRNCTNKGMVTALGGGTAGGISGASSAPIIGCVNKGEVFGSTAAAGISGVLTRGEITACSNFGKLTNIVDTDFWVYTYGIADSVDGNGIIRACSNHVKADYGITHISNVIGCYNTGSSTKYGISYLKEIANVIACYYTSVPVDTNIRPSWQSGTLLENGNWDEAMVAMNKALEGSGWKYEKNPLAGPYDSDPLILVEVE